MKKIIPFLFVLFIFSCKQNENKDHLEVRGEIKNANGQKIYLEELFFVQKQPQILDTAEIKNDTFSLSAVAKEEGMYRLRLEGGKQFFFVNDKSEILLKGDAQDTLMFSNNINTPANQLLKKFADWMETAGKEMTVMNNSLREKLTANPDDSTTKAFQQQMITKMNGNMEYLNKFVDTVSDPVVAMFALGYLDNGDNSKTRDALAALIKRFPSNKALTELEQQMKLPAKNEPATTTTSGKPSIGAVAPDITMNDTEGKTFSLSSLKGKYVLVDFWASWCGPCRDENPNVVKAYNRFKSKNFTVLGVSLDKQKDAWLQAIKEDGLAWKHISDLKFWESEAVSLYQFDGIPYNVLIDPSGKIIASDLRGEMLEEKLAAVLK